MTCQFCDETVSYGYGVNMKWGLGYVHTTCMQLWREWRRGHFTPALPLQTDSSTFDNEIALA